MKPENSIYVAGHRGMVGSAIVRRLELGGYQNLLLKTHQELDLLDQAAVHSFLKSKKPDVIIIAAARVGGIQANNTQRADFIYENLMIEANLIHAAWQAGVQRLLFLGSSCIYPREAPQPIKEEYLLTGLLEPTNEPYAIAKIAGIKLCESYNRQYGTNYLSVMPTNLYGPNDNFDLESSHVLPALLRKMHEAKTNKDNTVKIWGTGKPRREFLHVDDMADACLFLLEQEVEEGLINVGAGSDITISELAKLIKEVVNYKGEFVFESNKPDGMMQKLLDVSKLSGLGWKPKYSLTDGINQVYGWYQSVHCQNSVA